jgi:nucleoside-triphosphatase
MASLFIVTGDRGAGKTTFCRYLVELARDAGRQAAGILSLPVFANEQKFAIEAQDLRTGQSRRLAIRQETGQQPTTGPHTPGWRFDPVVLSWGNTVLQAACPCELFIVDELGPLEFERGEGWLAGLSALDTGIYRWGLATIRPELLAAGQKRWPMAEVISIPKNADLSPMARSLAQQFWLD